MLRNYLRMLISVKTYVTTAPGSFIHSELQANANDVNSISSPRISRSNAEFLAKMLFLPSHSPRDSRLLKVAVIGFPNAGKSSLVNMLTKWRVCAVSGKAHTTRSKQTVVFTKDNIQLAFVDLPGIVSMGQAKRFKLEKNFIRDPHAAVIDADLILIIVDSSNKYSRAALDPEIIKTLHFFSDKESVLVLNKIDKSSGNPTRLLEVTRRLTEGIVNGRPSHLDAYENRFNHRALLASKDNARPRFSVEEVIYPRLPRIAHEAANRRLEYLKNLRTLLGPPQSFLEEAVESFPTHTPNFPILQIQEAQTVPEKLSTYNDAETIPHHSSLQMENHKEINSCLNSDTLIALTGDRKITDLDSENIEDFFTSYKPENRENSAISQPTDPEKKTEEEAKEVYLESVIEAMKTQLMLNSATKDEVEARKKRWLELAIQLRGASTWKGFREVFMVSSATGEGIANLREYLLKRAKPGKSWLLSPALITDQEPNELIRMCLWAHCLNQLPKEVPYSLTFAIDDCERTRFEGEGDDRIYVHARIRCRNERIIKRVLGVKGEQIRSLAGAIKAELTNMFQTPTVVKLTAEMVTGPSSRRVIRRLRKSKDVLHVLPEYRGDTSTDNVDVTTTQI